jgi:hypothetical protein
VGSWSLTQHGGVRRVNQDKPQPAQPQEVGTPDEQFEQLRERFHERLRKEQRQLAILTKSLGSANVAWASVLSDIQVFAHRLRGAALVFGYQGLGDGAKAVELAAIGASLNGNGRPCEPSVVTAMQALAIDFADELGAGANARAMPK